MIISLKKRIATLALSLGLTALSGNVRADAAAPASPPTASASNASTSATVSTSTNAPAALPDLNLPDLAGKRHDSKEWKGKMVVLDFWATWCAGCRATIPVLTRLNETYGPKGLAVAGISIDKEPAAKVSKFARKLKMNYPVLLDAEDTMSKVFGFEGIPSVYVFGRDGKLLKAMPAYTAAREKDLEGLVAAQFQSRSANQ